MDFLLKLAVNLLESYANKNISQLTNIWETLSKRAVFQELLDTQNEIRQIYQKIFEIQDDILFNWIFSGNETQELWRLILIPDEQCFFRFHIINLNALWLQLSGSNRLENKITFPDSNTFKRLNYQEQAKFLGRFCSRTNSESPLNYEKIAKSLPKKLLPFFANWFLEVYLNSPFSNVFVKCNENKVHAMNSFVSFHKEQKVELFLHPFHYISAFRCAYYPIEVRDFLETFFNKINSYKKTQNFVCKNTNELNIKDSLKKESINKKESSDFKKGIFIYQWHRDTAIYRCIDPMLEKIKSELYGIYIGNQSVNTNLAPEKWQGNKNKILSYNFETNINSKTLSAICEHVAKLKLDFLFYPETLMDITCQKTALIRLAKVQAVGYGHPTTTGSPAMDYFVGGQMLEQNSNQYCERLVLLPKLGVGTTPPPLPQVQRKRPLNDERVFLMNQSSHYKLHPDLLNAWHHILQQSNKKALLMMYPAISMAHIQNHYAFLESFFPDDEVIVNPAVPRQTIIDHLEEADLYLDSYPFGGFNTLVEVLASGCPIVTLEGNSARNRFGAAMIRLLELPEFLVTHSYEEYITMATKLINDAILRQDLRAILSRERVLKILCAPEIAEHFAAAVDWMCQQGPYDQSKKLPPVYIEAGEKVKELSDVY